MTLLTDEPDRFGRALEALEGGFDISGDGGPAYEPAPLLIDRID
jgi:thymidine phosphorylase